MESSAIGKTDNIALKIQSCYHLREDAKEVRGLETSIANFEQQWKQADMLTNKHGQSSLSWVAI